ncbi:MAG: hypothetical protein OEO79_11375 [Gemmatimonadota bacterium]|nr:hypothetical protein [Gemmatimonadota bacterium]
MTRYLARLGLACTLVTAVGACVDERALSSATDLPAQTAFVEPRLQQVLDNLPGERLLRELSDADPSFGGYFADADSLVVLTTDLGRAESLRAVTEAKRPRPDRRGLSASSRPIAIRQGRYTFRQLARWRGVALTLVAGLPDFAGFDLDEGRNRLVVFLTDGSGEDAMRSALSDSSIPDDAITYEIIGEPILETT